MLSHEMCGNVANTIHRYFPSRDWSWKWISTEIPAIFSEFQKEKMTVRETDFSESFSS
jgi:hypothetical protein